MKIQIALGTSKQQTTQDFKRWFGRSKCVDSHGKPLRVYHGTNKTTFSSFINGLNKAHGETGIFFTSDPHTASLYSGYDENFPQPVIGHVLPVYLKIEKLLTYDFHGSNDAKVRIQVIRDAHNEGYDGVLLKNHADVGGSHPQWVVFDARHIKSATANNGKFDENSFDMGE